MKRSRSWFVERKNSKYPYRMLKENCFTKKEISKIYDEISKMVDAPVHDAIKDH